MNSEKIIAKIEKAMRQMPLDGRPSKFQNDIARVLMEGEFIARLDGFEWINGEGYPKGYYDAVINGMLHNLKVEHYPRNVYEFYNKFLFGVGE